MTEKFDKQKAFEMLLELRDGLKESARSPHLWLGWGFDHSYIDYFTPRLIETLNPMLEDDELVHSNLLKFIESVKKDLGDKRLKLLKGEMRYTNKDGTICYLSPHVISSRMDLKLANVKAERMLFRQAEPAATMAWQTGASYPAEFLEDAERQILLNQAHDSICGCSIDQVPRDMHYRYEQCFEICGEITRRSIFHVVSKIDYSGVAEGDVPITVFNTLAQKRTCVVRAAVDVPLKKGYLKEFELHDERGRSIPFQRIYTEDKRLLIMAKYNMPPRIDVERHHIYFLAEDVPSMGYRTYVARVRVKAKKTFWQRELKEHKATLVVAPNTLENEHLRVEITPQGTLNMLHKSTGKEFRGLHYFEDGGDLGEGWNYVPPVRDEIVSSLGASATISLIEDGPLCARYRVETRVLAPASASRTENTRSAERREIAVTSEIGLRAGSRRVEIKTTVDNTCRNHRLRVIFPSDICASDSLADGQFDVVKRPIEVPDRTGWKEPAPAEHPQQAFLDVTDG
ncbi:MAG: glycoside hydrolase family 38 C-terminal domain-containing protein, partial [Phycisphaerae bacterium]|nr:glycoside hydrolase family 38 C-terminal domain-containing protein [Phycisphaerae bacterium]